MILHGPVWLLPSQVGQPPTEHLYLAPGAFTFKWDVQVILIHLPI